MSSPPFIHLRRMNEGEVPTLLRNMSSPPFIHLRRMNEGEVPTLLRNMSSPPITENYDILDDYKKNGGDWPTYERKFLDLMGSRHIESKVDRYLLDGACLLCSEPTPHHCHRRLVAEYLKEKWGDVEIQHL